MSRFNLFLLFILAGLLIFARSDLAMEGTTTDRAQNAPAVTTTPTETPTPTPTVAPPASLSVPKIDVSAPIEPVGTDENGKMQLPQDISVVGWYEPGVKPGELGNAVIAGHLDSATGEGAIFYNLNTMEKGDDIVIYDQAGKKYRFTVTEKVVYPYNQVPLDKIFGKSSKKMLNLITCTGIWNPAIKNYSHRMIIFSELQSVSSFSLSPKP
ncbi:hypothetical protein A3B40_03705 [Candidatus Roizmanbacteria bacterium RIFCSPLOWO2_01_FULL_37_16]|uniref:Peptidase C60 sortase A and B n=1 Tax=Candidatus Roizmanbacteria bacterium RIFCSPLOWO2_01_FULL_37_16 TaxID=1802058 RepID=A0A1F7ILN1_9BACT|nr:MAG: hypothetical protein A3B40_03705 [Candidatus Roizmanbacteria bacterium RIFCSPLOWO2_01_FULL_37_16]